MLLDFYLYSFFFSTSLPWVSIEVPFLVIVTMTWIFAPTPFHPCIIVLCSVLHTMYDQYYICINCNMRYIPLYVILCILVCMCSIGMMWWEMYLLNSVQMPNALHKSVSPTLLNYHGFGVSQMGIFKWLLEYYDKILVEFDFSCNTPIFGWIMWPFVDLSFALGSWSRV